MDERRVESSINVGTNYGLVAEQVINQFEVIHTAPGDWKQLVKPEGSPYRFPSAYSGKDRVLFKGREEAIETVWNRLQQQHLLVVYGQEAVGKTSLMAAGVNPRLADEGFTVLHIPDYPASRLAMRRGLQKAAEQIGLPLEGDTPAQWVASVLGDSQRRLLVVFDQFERLFEAGIDRERRMVFIQGLREALQAQPERLWAVLVVREVALKALLELKAELPGLLDQPFWLKPLKAAEARKALEEPLEAVDWRWRIRYAPDVLAQRILPDLDDLTPGGEGDIAPAQLQTVAHFLYQKALDNQVNLIDQRLYDQLGGVEGILAESLKQALQTQEDAPLVEQILRTLAQPEVGPWASEGVLLPATDLAKGRQVLDGLVKQGFLVWRSREEGGQAETQYAFAGDRLLEEVSRLFKLDRKAEDELERIWRGWLAHQTLASPEQLRYLQAEGHLHPRADKALLLLRSAVYHDQDPRPWLEGLKADSGRSLLQQLELEAPVNEAGALTSLLQRAKEIMSLGEIRPAQGAPFGGLTLAAVAHPNPAARMTATLALSVPYPKPMELLPRLDEALDELKRSWQRWSRRAEVRGVLADADPEIEERNRRMPLWDRLWVWGWRVRRRLWRDRYPLFWYPVGAALAGGLAIALWRLLLWLLLPDEQPEFSRTVAAIYGLWATWLGLALALGLRMARSLQPFTPTAPTQGLERRAAWIRLWVTAALGAVSFALMHMAVAWMTNSSGLSLLEHLALAMLLGLGLALALWQQPEVGYRLGWGWLWRLGAVALGAALTKPVMALTLGWSSERFELGLNHLSWTPEHYPNLPNLLSWVDTVAVAFLLALGMTVGLCWTRYSLERWISTNSKGGEA